MALFYLVMYAGVGAYSPYLTLYLHRLGISSAEIGLLMAVSPLVTLLSQPVWGLAADWRQNRRSTLLFILGGVTVASLLLSQVRMIWALALALGLLALFQGSLMPIADAMTLDEVVRDGGDYSGRRLYGSLGFALTATGAGWLFTRVDLRNIFILYAGFAALAWLVIRQMPHRRAAGPTWGRSWAEVRELGAAGGLWAFLAVAALVAVTNQAHSAFFSIYLDALKARSSVIGFTWTLAALVETPVFYFVGHLLNRFGVRRVAVLGVGLFAARFFLYSVARTPWQVVAVQVLAGVTFGIYQSAAVTLVGELAPPALRATSQTLFAAVTGGLAAILGSVVGGQIVERFGPVFLYRINAGVALVATLLCAALLPVMQPAGRPHTQQSSPGSGGAA